MMKRILITMGFVGLLAGCASKGPATDVPVENRDTATTTSPVQTPGTQGVQSTPVIGNVLKTDPLKDPNNILSKPAIYFDSHKDSVKPEFTPIFQPPPKSRPENPGP